MQVAPVPRLRDCGELSLPRLADRGPEAATTHRLLLVPLGTQVWAARFNAAASLSVKSLIKEGFHRGVRHQLLTLEYAMLMVDLARETHRRLKAACAMAGTKMNDEIRRFVERRCTEFQSSR